MCDVLDRVEMRGREEGLEEGLEKGADRAFRSNQAGRPICKHVWAYLAEVR